MTTIEEIKEVLAGKKLPLKNEKRLQFELELMFIEAGLTFEREHRLSDEDVVDFLFEGGIAMECKLKEGKMAIYKQLERYAKHQAVEKIVLITNTAMGLPESINGKDSYLISLGEAWM